MKEIAKPYLVIFSVIASFLVMLIIIMESCGDRSDLFKDIGGTIVSMNGVKEDELVPSATKVVFIKLDNGMYGEINNKELPFMITNEWWYNHRPGDKVHFDYISKKRFFIIKR